MIGSSPLEAVEHNIVDEQSHKKFPLIIHTIVERGKSEATWRQILCYTTVLYIIGRSARRLCGINGRFSGLGVTLLTNFEKFTSVD